MPKPPSWVDLGKAGTAWWKWAWKTPQAAGWAAGHEVAVARRASLEDALAEGTTGLVGLCREMRELDDRLGLTPKGMAALRWSIVADAKPAQQPGKSAGGKVSSLDDRRRRLTDAS